METSKNIYQRIAAVMAEIGYIQKDRNVSTGGGSYKAVSHDTVVATLRPFIIKHGIQPTISMIEGAFDDAKEGSKQRLFRATFVVAFVNCDKPEESVSMVVPAHALDSGDKAPGKAISYAFKYAMLKTFCLETGEDEESRIQIGDYDFGMALAHGSGRRRRRYRARNHSGGSRRRSEGEGRAGREGHLCGLQEAGREVQGGEMMEEIIQGSAEWMAQRCGRITASRIADVLAKTKTGESASRANYAAQLVAERLTGTVAETFVSKEMERGITVEPLARTSYEILRGVDVDQVAFIQHPTIERSGASPDGLVGLDGLIECKAPNTATHIGYAVTRVIPTKYQLQMLWQISVMGREWCDFVSYDDDCIKRCPR